jgi:hypothetical protein
VIWTFDDVQGNEISIKTKAYYVPKAKSRLLSPQRIFNKKRGVSGCFSGDEEKFSVKFNDLPALEMKYDARNSLPIGYARNGGATESPQVNLSIVNDENQNLTQGQKLLLSWHARFGHMSFKAVQRILRVYPFNAVKIFSPASKCDIAGVRCEICQYAKQHRTSIKTQKVTTVTEKDGGLKKEDLRPGQTVSVDHFESRLRGRTYDSQGRSSSASFKGGAIFVDHASGYIHVEHQLGFSASETIRAKQIFEKLAMDNGVTVQSYLTDNGAFKANEFVAEINKHQQKIHYCGAYAHHGNGVAERAVKTVSNMARAMLLHSSAHWKEGINSSLWPMAVNYATHIYNTTPKENGVCPADIFLGTTVPRHRLQHLHTWGCPVYILDPTLANGSKLPRWQPKSRLGIFVGMSKFHSSDVPLVLNIQTGFITAQFHVVFDDLFSTVSSIGREEEPPDHWQYLCLHSHYVASDEKHSHLADEWLTPQERESKRRQIEHETKVRHTFEPKQQAPAVSVPTAATPAPIATESTTLAPAIDPAPSIASTATPNAPTTTVPPVQPPSTSAAQSSSGLRRSSRATRGQFNSTRYIDEQANATSTDWKSYEATLAYNAEVVTDYDTGMIDIVDPRVYAAKVRRNDPDNPSFKQATEGPHASEYIEAMKLEVATLVSQRAWSAVTRSEAVDKGANILKGTWCFKLKRLPDGAAYRFKARYCARGDLQQEGVNFFETYVPVV